MDHLSGWKEIAAYLGRGVRTVQRWAAAYGLPVHKPRYSRGGVQATKEELDLWIANSPVTGLSRAAATSALKRRSGKPSILIVDDHEATLYAVTRMMQSAGFAVTQSSTGRQVLSEATSRHPDLIILDVNLPDISGFDICKRLKANASTASIPVLFLSSTFHSSSAKQLAEYVGAAGFLFHPIEPNQLASAVKATLKSSGYTIS